MGRGCVEHEPEARALRRRLNERAVRPEDECRFSLARAIYLGDEEERWDDIKPQVRPYAHHVVAEITRLDSDS